MSGWRFAKLLTAVLVGTLIATGADAKLFFMTRGVQGPLPPLAITSVSITCGSSCSYLSPQGPGTEIGTANATMSAGSFTGTWSTTGPAAADFTFVGNSLQINSSTPGCTSVTPLSLNIVATQPGAAQSPYPLAITVTCNPAPTGSTCDIGPSYVGSTPAAATQAGMTHCTANYDFTQTSSFTDNIGTHTWSTLSSWLNCSNFGTSPYLFKFAGDVGCNTSHQNITTDGGTQVLALTYGLADAQAGHYGNRLENFYGSNGNPIPGEYYIEMVVKTSSNNCDTNAPPGQGCVYFDVSTFSTVGGHPCYVASDSEWDNQLTVIHQGVAPWNFNSGSCADTGGGVGPLQNGWTANTSYNTYGILVTADNVSKYGMCSYGRGGAISGLQASDFINCLTMSTSGAGSSVFSGNLFMYVVAGPQSASQGGSVWTLNSLTVDIQRITFWSCAAWPTQCYNNPVITTHP